MLKLKKLQILGFKSFCDRTELKFHGAGIAAIIGPNGCGKSNIADAISWVLGEQSAKTLRGSRMEDVIFSGTRERKPTGMAEVSLTLIDPQVYPGADANEPTEIDVQDEIPDGSEDWDEAALRTQAAEETERASAEAQPGKLEEVQVLSPEEAGPGKESEIPQAETSSNNGQPFDVPHSIGSEPSTSDARTTGLQVVLKIRRRKFNQQQFRAGEIVVTRRLFRSGESEYLLNSKLCRLRDVQELFMGTGLGSESYALIEQGRIGQILSSRPTDRRAMIEEAAGVTKFKTKKRLAEARLEEARLNLSRINDIFEEVTRQMNSLKRQAAKAERYARLRDEMRAQLRVVLASKFGQIEQEAGQLDAQLTAVAEEMRAQVEAVEQLESEQAERTQRGYAIESESRQNRERLSAIELEMDRAQARRRHNDERCQELVVRASNSDAELAQVAFQLASCQAELDSNRQVLDSAATDLAAAHNEYTRSQEAVSAETANLADLESQQEQSRGKILEIVAAIAQLRNQLIQAEERLAAVERETARLTGEMQTAASQLEAFGGQRGQLALEFDTVSERVAGLAEEIVQLRRTIEWKRQQESESKRCLDDVRAEYASALGKRSSLEAVIAEHGYSTESVRRLFQSGAMQGGMAPTGVLADFLEVEPRYEGVVEDFLRDELNYVVVQSWDAADEGLRLLRSDVDGRATFLVHPNDAQAKFSFLVEESARPGPPSQPIVPVKNCIRVLNGFGKSLEAILPKLRDGYIVPDSAIGRGLALENSDAFFLSAESGECFHNLTVTGGRQRAEGPLSMKRELRDVLRLLAELERALAAEEQRALTLGREIDELSSLFHRLENEQRGAEKQAMTSGHLLDQLDFEMSRVNDRLHVARQEITRQSVERDEQQAMISSRQREISILDIERAQLEERTASRQAALAAARERRDAAAQTASEHMARVATLTERHRAAAAVLERIESLVAELTERQSRLRMQFDSSVAEKQQRETENQQLLEQVQSLEAERNAAQVRESLLQFESEQVRGRLTEIEESLRHARQLLEQNRDRRGDLAAAVARLQSDAQHMAETCMNELGVERGALMADTSLALVSGDELNAQDAQYRQMRARLDAMGPVNMMALEEYREVGERHQFLETQRQDLLESIANTTATIKEIDTVSRQKFAEAFNKINENFTKTFQKLFGGGHAFMRLTDEENSAESGIDVVASPPGKKLQNVLLLSGGEKALTALALLVGIFQYQPSPFCILDEVDAPLDEANVARFAELVKEMSVQTQFVLITHSKKTMSIAPVMYGVTMQEPGVSKLVSVRFGAA